MNDTFPMKKSAILLVLLATVLFGPVSLYAAGKWSAGFGTNIKHNSLISLNGYDVQEAGLQPPSGLNAELIAPNAVQLTWTDNSNDEDGFVIERNENNAGFVVLDTLAHQDSTQYIDTTVINNYYYAYRVSAYSSSDNSVYSDSDSILVMNTFTPILSLWAVTPNAVQLNWQYDAGGMAGFIVEKKLSDSIDFISLDTLAASVTSYTDSSVVNGQSYNYKVTAFDSLNQLSISNEVLAAVSNQGIVADSIEISALRDLYEQTNGDNWTIQNDSDANNDWPRGNEWDATTSLSQVSGWYGVLKKNGDISELRLNKGNSAGINLQGEIPESICELKALIRIWMNYSKLTGEIPSSIGNLQRLAHFWLFNNQLTGEIPMSAYTIRTMSEFAVDDNQLEGELPTEIGNWMNMKNLFLGGNNFSGLLPESMSVMTKMERLYLANNNFSGSLPEFIGTFTKIWQFDIGNNNFSGNLPSTFKNLHSWYTYLDNNNFEGELGDALSGSTNIGYLTLDGNNFSGPIPEYLGDFSELIWLNMAQNNFTGEIPDTLKNLGNLQVLAVNDNELTGTIPEDISLLSKLWYFGVSGNDITGTIPNSFQNLTKLKWIDLQETQLEGPIPDYFLDFPDLYLLNAYDSKFDYIPDFKQHPNKANLQLNIWSNNLDFEDIEKQFTGPGAHPFDSLAYTPQNDFGVGDTTAVGQDSTIVMTSMANGQHTHYQWQKKNGPQWVDIAGGTDSTLTITDFQLEDAGMYRIKATNDWASDLTLYSAARIVNVGTEINDITPADKNYILEYTTRMKGVDESMYIGGLGTEYRMANITYFDGLGRPVQQTAIQASPVNGMDIIVPMQYDDFGRESDKYLPYAASGNGSYQGNAIDAGYTTAADHYQFYTNAQNGVVDDPKPFSHTVFEPSPLNRVLKQGAPGSDWQPDSVVSADDHSVKFEYTTNDSAEVFLWKVKNDNCILADGDYYDPNELYVTVTKDENWQSTQTFTEAGTVREYKDKQGRVVLKRTYAVKDDNTGVDEYDTYYVYDDFGNLRFVIPPMAIAQLGSSLEGIDENNVFSEDTTLTGTHNEEYYYYPGVTVTLGTTFNGTTGFSLKPYPLNADLEDEYLFTYKYDSRQRMVEKKVPGAAPVYMVYDQRDRLVLTQDGEQRKDSIWLFTKYDALNRSIMTGLYSDGQNREDMQGDVDAVLVYFETFDSEETHNYTNNSFPNTNIDEYFTVTYYDNYEFSTNTDLGYVQNTDDPYDDLIKLDNPKGQVTGGKVKNLATNAWHGNAVYYDRKYRPIYTVSENHKDGLDKTYNAYNFIGDMTNSRYVHTATNQDSLTIDKEFNYDQVSRLLSIGYKVNGGNPATLLANEYNEIGELVTKYLHGNQSSSAQQVDYAYNIRGWLTGINDPANVSLAGDYFGMELKYNETPAPLLNSEAQYNGNISEIHWANAQTDQLSGYGFRYDAINRLKTSRYGEGSSFTVSNGHWDENMTYDFNGNINSLLRKAAGQIVDSLDYGYTGNRLDYVDDGITSYSGEENHFKDGTPGTGIDYGYDDNGNMTSDANKGIQSISYNHLNLPEHITFDNGNSIQYIYDAAGVKLSKVVTENSTSTTTDYIGGIVYESGVRKFISTEEGRIMLESAPEYQYHLKDHLGNVRLTFTTASTPDQTSTYMATMESEPEVAALEAATFDNISSTQHQDQLYNITDSLVVPGAEMSARLNVVGNRAMGPAMSLHVMPGDTINMSVFAKYAQTVTNPSPVEGMAAIIAASAGVGAVTEAAQVAAGVDILSALQAALFSPDDSHPMAYINYLFFDKNRQHKSEGFKRISTAALDSFEELSLSFFPDEEGYMIIYVSNQTDEDLNVYFDDLAIEHIEGPIVQTDDYYPFGLTFNSSERSGFTSNNHLFNGVELQNELDLGLYQTLFRMYDPALGRFAQLDPLEKVNLSSYAWVTNNPLLYADPYGLDSINYNDLPDTPIDVDNDVVILDPIVIIDEPDNYVKVNNETRKDPIEWSFGIPLIGGDANGQSTGYVAKNEFWFDFDWISVLSMWITRNKMTNKDKKDLTYERNKGQNSQRSNNDKSRQILEEQSDGEPIPIDTFFTPSARKAMYVKTIMQGKDTLKSYEVGNATVPPEVRDAQ